MFVRMGVLAVVAAVGAKIHHDRAKRMRVSRGRKSSGGAAQATDLSPIAELWYAAESGNPAAVRRLLEQHGIKPDTPHHTTGAHLVLELARAATEREQLDSALKQVLVVLAKAGWSLRTPRSPSGENALHLLVDQAWGCHVYHRVIFLLDAELIDPSPDNLLTMENAEGMTVEDVATQGRGELVSILHVRKLQIRNAVGQSGGRAGGPFALLWNRVLRLRSSMAMRVLE